MPIIFEWDEAKRQVNLRKHGLDFRDCGAVFAGVTATFADDRFSYTESRRVSYGLLNGVVVVIAHADHADIIRIISMRKARRHEQILFFKECPVFKD